MPRKAILGLVAMAAIFGGLSVNYAYFRGLDDGADAMLCTMSHQIDGAEFAMKQRYCKAIAGRKPMFGDRIFGGDQ